LGTQIVVEILSEVKSKVTTTLVKNELEVKIEKVEPFVPIWEFDDPL
jgi:hypothetical protein